MAMVCCTVITLASLLYVFAAPGELSKGSQKTRTAHLCERKDVAYENLRDLNFEYRAGKIPDADYQSLKTSLQDEAATLLAEIGRLKVKATLRKEKP